MDQKIDRPAIVSHIKNVAFDLAADLFEEKETLNGKDVMNATKIPQVNFFVLKILFNNWKREMKSIRSPYFNYDAPEVKEAVKKLGETLSYQISLKKETFVGLLERAFEQYVDYLNNPYQFLLNNFIPQNESRLQVNDLGENLKYFKINTFFIEDVIEKIKTLKLQELSHEDGKSCIMEVYENVQQDLEKPGPYFKELQEHYDFPFSNNEQNQSIRQDEISSTEVEVKEAPAPQENAVEFDYTKKGNNATLNDLYSDYSKSKKLNDQLKPEKEDRTILEKHQKSKINSLVNSIAINQKYHFINTLFHGDASSFESAIKTLDSCPSKEEASKLIAVDFTEKYGWDESKDMDVSKLLQLVERKF